MKRGQVEFHNETWTMKKSTMKRGQWKSSTMKRGQWKSSTMKLGQWKNPQWNVDNEMVHNEVNRSQVFPGIFKAFSDFSGFASWPGLAKFVRIGSTWVRLIQVEPGLSRLVRSRLVKVSESWPKGLSIFFPKFGQFCIQVVEGFYCFWQDKVFVFFCETETVTLFFKMYCMYSFLTAILH